MNNSGIYIITFNTSNNFYIGRALNFKNRIKKHLYELRKGIHKNSKLQNSFNKYGEDSILYGVKIPLPEDEYIHKEIEQILVDNLYDHPSCMNQSRSASGGNVAPMTEERKKKISASNKGRGFGLKRSPEVCAKLSIAFKGRKFSDETREKNSNSQKGKILSDETKRKISYALSGSNHPNFNKKGMLAHNSISILQISIVNLEIIAEFSCAAEAERLKGYSASSITRVCRGEQKQAHGYFWVKKHTYKEDVQRLKLNKKFIDNKDHLKRGAENPTSKKIIQLDKDNNYINTFDSISIASNLLGFDPSSIVKSCKGKLKTAYGYKWKYKEDYDKYIKQEV